MFVKKAEAAAVLDAELLPRQEFTDKLVMELIDLPDDKLMKLRKLIVDGEIFQHAVFGPEKSDRNERSMKQEPGAVAVQDDISAVFDQQSDLFPTGLRMIGNVADAFEGAFFIKIIPSGLEVNGDGRVAGKPGKLFRKGSEGGGSVLFGIGAQKVAESDPDRIHRDDLSVFGIWVPSSFQGKIKTG